jgi:hypothetical protein
MRLGNASSPLSNASRTASSFFASSRERDGDHPVSSSMSSTIYRTFRETESKPFAIPISRSFAKEDGFREGLNPSGSISTMRAGDVTSGASIGHRA